MKHFRMLAAGLCSAVLLCGFAIPAYAYSDGGNEEPPVVEETPAPDFVMRCKIILDVDSQLFLR